MSFLFWTCLLILAFFIIDGNRKYNALEARLRDIQVSDQKRRTEQAARIKTLELSVDFLKAQLKGKKAEPKKEEKKASQSVQIVKAENK